MVLKGTVRVLHVEFCSEFTYTVYDEFPGTRENRLECESLAATFFQRPRVIVFVENGVHLYYVSTYERVSE